MSAVLDLARSLGMDVVAEGVETTEQADRLRLLGVERAQGWLFARPLRGGGVRLPPRPRGPAGLRPPLVPPRDTCVAGCVAGCVSGRGCGRGQAPPTACRSSTEAWAAERARGSSVSACSREDQRSRAARRLAGQPGGRGGRAASWAKNARSSAKRRPEPAAALDTLAGVAPVGEDLVVQQEQPAAVAQEVADQGEVLDDLPPRVEPVPAGGVDAEGQGGEVQPVPAEQAGRQPVPADGVPTGCRARSRALTRSTVVAAGCPRRVDDPHARAGRSSTSGCRATARRTTPT